MNTIGTCVCSERTLDIDLENLEDLTTRVTESHVLAFAADTLPTSPLAAEELSGEHGPDEQIQLGISVHGTTQHQREKFKLDRSGAVTQVRSKVEKDAFADTTSEKNLFRIGIDTPVLTFAIDLLPNPLHLRQELFFGAELLANLVPEPDDPAGAVVDMVIQDCLLDFIELDVGNFGGVQEVALGEVAHGLSFGLSSKIYFSGIADVLKKTDLCYSKEKNKSVSMTVTLVLGSFPLKL